MSFSNLIDARGPRFAATVTTVVLATVILTGWAWLLLIQAFVFAIGATMGPTKSPYGQVFQKFIKPRLAPPTQFENIEPPKFAQLVGMLFAIVGLLGNVLGTQLVFMGAASAAFAAAFLNSAFGYCLGCKTYLLLKRFSPVQ